VAGQVPTESGLHTLRAVPASTAESMLRHIVDTVGVPVIVHCCAPSVPLGLLRAAGASAVSIDLSLISGSLFSGSVVSGPLVAGTAVAGSVDDIDALDALGELLDAGLGLFAGAAPTSTAAGPPPSSAQIAGAVTTLWRRIGLSMSRLPEQVVVTPACGLAGASMEYARATLSACVEAGHRLA
jgi:methionine synthase II (cobalamin-independent)